MSEIVLRVEGIKKSFGSLRAVRGISLEVKGGEMVAIVGPNGSGKTTLLKMVVGVLKGEAGSVWVKEREMGKEPVEAKKEIGYVADRPEAYPFLTGWEFLYLTGKLKGVGSKATKEKLEPLIKDLGIEEIVESRMEGYSRGSWQKVALLAALIIEPHLIVVDEPVAGLDPESIKWVGKTLREAAMRGAAVVMVTHTLDFAEEYADRTILIVKGEVVGERMKTDKISLEEWYRRELKK